MRAIWLGSLFLYDIMAAIKTLRSYRKWDYLLHIGFYQKLPSCWGFLSLTFITLVHLSSSSILFYWCVQNDISIRFPRKWKERFVFDMKVPFFNEINSWSLNKNTSPNTVDVKVAEQPQDWSQSDQTYVCVIVNKGEDPGTNNTAARSWQISSQKTVSSHLSVKVIKNITWKMEGLLSLTVFRGIDVQPVSDWCHVIPSCTGLVLTVQVCGTEL